MEFWAIFRETENYSWKINKHGDVRRFNKKNNSWIDVCSVRTNKENYDYIDFLNDDEVNIDRFFIDELVAKYFVTNNLKHNEVFVIHKDDNRQNNSFDNLEYISIVEANFRKLQPRRLPKFKEVSTIKVEIRKIENEEEKWKPCTENDLYLISNFGNVKFEKTNKFITKFKQNKGYLILMDTDEYGKNNFIYIHKQVAVLFLEKVDNKIYVKHKNTNKKDNFYKNLEYVTHYELYKNKIKEARISHYWNNKQDNSDDEEVTKKQPLTRKEINKRYYENKKQKELSKSLQN